MRAIQRFAVAVFAAGIAVTTVAIGAEPAPSEEIATAVLNKKIADDNVSLDASETAKQEAYQQQVKLQQEAYEQQVKQQQAQYEQQKADYARQVEEQKVAYQQQLDEQKADHQRQLEQYEQQVKAAAEPPPKRK